MDTQGRNILIVEDEMITAIDLRNQLRRLGYAVSGLAKSGDQAVRLSEKLHPDLVLMDVNLSGAMNGIEASQRMQGTKRIPVVYITSNPNVFIRTPTDMQRPYLCLAKPISVPILQAVLEVAFAS